MKKTLIQKLATAAKFVGEHEILGGKNFPVKLHLDEDKFFTLFKEWETDLNYNGDHAKLENIFDGVTFFCLVETTTETNTDGWTKKVIKGVKS